ncbi:MAG TPA: hypothetical protein VFB68_11810 [Xanthobacteraceae bacterium]|nr:hypothetical protein [Xanthobacteraceae bacterium]
MIGRRMTWAGLISLPLMATEAPAQLGTEMKLTDAGFVMRIAKSPKQLERLRTIPARRMVARTKAGVRHYLYADPAGCQCVLVGDERAMRNYRDMVAPPALPPGFKDFEGAPRDVGVNPERDIIQEINADGEPPWADGEEDMFAPVLDVPLR